MLANCVCVSWLTVRCETHELVFAAVYFEAAIISERGIEQAERVRKFQFAEQSNSVAFADADCRSRPFAYAINCENCRLIKRAGEERAGGVTFVMFCENEFRITSAFEVSF